MTKMQSARVSEGCHRCVNKKDDKLKMVSWVPIIVVEMGRGQWRSKG